MDAILERAIEADQQHLGGAQPTGQVHRLKAAVLAPAHLMRRIEQHGVVRPPGRLIEHARRDETRLAYTKAGGVSELADVVAPPSPVAGVGDVGPGDEAPGVVDGDPSDLWPRRTPRCFKVDVPV